MGEETSLIEALVTGIICLMLVAAVTTMASKRLSKLPLTIALVFVGIAISALSDRVPALGLISSSVHLTPQLVLYVFIPTLIFESAFNMNAREVSRNIWPIMMLAGPGLILSTLIIGGMMAWMTHFDLMVAMLLGAILSATDPVAVIAIFKQLGVPERLTVLVEGESLFNDATSLVVATILLGILVKGDFSAAVVGDGVVQFFVVFFGGVLVGWLLAIIAGQTLGRIEEDPLVEITLTTILAYFSFIVADHVFHVSGIMAVVASGLTIGSWGRSKISPSTEAFMKHFWEYLAYLANAFIFLMVGMEMNLVTLWHSIGLIAAVALAMLVSRAAVVFLLVPLVGKLPGSEPTSLPWQGVMYWGGLRGAIAIAIVLSLPHFAYKDTLIAVVLGAVLFTLIVEGLSIEPMVKWLGLDALSLPDQLVKLEGDRHARQEGLARLDTVVSGGMFSTRVAENIRARSLREIAELDAELKKLHTSMDASEARELLAMRCLVREKARYRELFARGLINEWAYRELDNTVNVQLDGVRHQAALPSARFETSFGKALDLF
ncbi:MAG TPA: sodium:proton antiporter, partial [Pseudomonadales bacterium]|nr:sodium:proton antiporter [Pseudomonadales bacterium]